MHRGKENEIKQEIKKSVNEEKNNHKSIHLMKLHQALHVSGHNSFAPVNISFQRYETKKKWNQTSNRYT